jgi:hypothetical protein
MSKATFNVAPSNASDATFRVWGKALSDALQAVGCIKTADTGQIDWATVARAAINTYAGYEIRQLPASAWQTACPVLIKIEFGAGTTQTFAAIKVTLCKTTDGAGTPTGIISSSALLINTATSTTATDCFVSCGDDYVSWSLWVTAASTLGQQFYIARPKTAAGVATNNGASMIALASNYSFAQWLPLVGVAFPATPATGFCCSGPKVGTGTYGSYVGVFPIFSYQGYAAHPDGIGIAYFIADIATGGVETTIEIFGVNHTFITGAPGASSVGCINGNTTSSGLMVRYE